MGKRDFGHRETKKQKKDTKKIPQVTILKPSVEVEVIKKVRKNRELEETES
jgi:hypothetical protein